MHLCSRICWFENNLMNQSIKGIWGDVMLWKIHEHFDIFFLHCYTTSILIFFNNCWSFECRMAAMAKISLIQFVLWRQHHHSASASLTVTEQSLHLSTTKTSSRYRVQEVYPWCQTSGVNCKVRICRLRNVAVALCAAGSRCQCCWWLCCCRKGGSYWLAWWGQT